MSSNQAVKTKLGLERAIEYLKKDPNPNLDTQMSIMNLEYFKTMDRSKDVKIVRLENSEKFYMLQNDRLKSQMKILQEKFEKNKDFASEDKIICDLKQSQVERDDFVQLLKSHIKYQQNNINKLKTETQEMKAKIDTMKRKSDENNGGKKENKRRRHMSF